jgi:pyruvate ferredoxin oxidoreductase gamma subunit/phenylglyoxylate dehydrogenase gamma subunit
MYEIRIHGRGGQGAVVAATILAQAVIDEGKHAVAIPSFGFERRGAPVSSFLRFDDKPIRAMTNIYRPDCVVCIDPTIRRAVNVFAGLKDNGTLVLTAKAGLRELDLPAGLGKVGVCDAIGIALALFRRPITNTIMLGAFAHVRPGIARRPAERASFDRFPRRRARAEHRGHGPRIRRNAGLRTGGGRCSDSRVTCSTPRRSRTTFRRSPPR